MAVTRAGREGGKSGNGENLNNNLLHAGPLPDFFPAVIYEHGGLHRSHRRSLRGVPAPLRYRPASGLPRHRRRGGEQQLRAQNHPGRFHPHFIRTARGPRRITLVPRPDGTSGSTRPHLPAACARARRRQPQPARRPHRRHHHLSARRLAAPRGGRALRPARRRPRQTPPRRRRLRPHPPQRPRPRRLAAPPGEMRAESRRDPARPRRRTARRRSCGS